MPKYRVHVYPIYRAEFTIEGDLTPEQAKDLVAATVTFPTGCDRSAEWNGQHSECLFSDDVEAYLVDVMDENGNRTKSIEYKH